MNQLKGACIIGQSGGPTAVINASAYGVIRTALDNPNITKVYGAAHGIRGVLDDVLYDMGQEDPTELELMMHTPSSILGSCRYKLKDYEEDETDYQRILEIFKKYDVRYFFYNGGNDSMDTCNKISKFMQKVGYECRIMGVPKTIDNDLWGTDHCPGFASAAKYVATSCMELYHDAFVYDTSMICIIEIMGRHAGWLAGSAAVASSLGQGPDLVYLPEVDFDLDAFLADVSRIYNKRGKCIIAVSEGIHDREGKLIAETDVQESFLSGQKAVEYAAVAGVTDKMVGLERSFDKNGDYVCNIKLVELTEAANTEKKVPLEWINARGNGVTSEFIDYVKPLIQGSPKLVYENGLPRFAKLKKVPAK